MFLILIIFKCGTVYFGETIETGMYQFVQTIKDELTWI